MPAARPRRSRSCTFFTVNRTASHAVLAPEAAIASPVITVPGGGAPGCSIPGCPPLHPAAAAERCATRVPSPHRRSSLILSPYPPSRSPPVALPAAHASLYSHTGAHTPIPSCGCATRGLACARSAMHALLTHPLVGWIVGVAAR